jgi:flagellin
MVVQHNISGMNANRQLNITTGIQAKSSEKLSSGYRINRAADDAAGLAISEKMRRQIRGLSQASNNAQDGVSWCQIADGALDEVSNMISRAKELAVQAANDTLTDEDRGYINEEMQKMASEIDRTHESTEFNNIHVFTDDGYAPNEMKAATDNTIKIDLPNGRSVEVSLGFVDSEGHIVAVENSSPIGNATDYANSDFAKFIQNAAASAVKKLSEQFPNLFGASSSDNIQIGLDLSRIDVAGKTLAQAWFGFGSVGDSTIMQYWMQVDSADYNINNYDSMTNEQKADLAAVIAHEMTHLVMYDTLTDGMVPGATNPYPDWFAEGAAQTSSGDNGWLSNHLSKSSSESQIKNYMSQLSSMEYGAGYLATMYLGYAVQAKQGKTAVTSQNIAEGLDALMTDMAKNRHSLNQAIKELTNYGGQKAFENAFKSADAASLQFAKNFLAARNDTGAGSLFDDLNKSEAQVFDGVGSDPVSTNSYFIRTDHPRYGNSFGAPYDFAEKDQDMLGSAELYLQVGSETSSENEIVLRRYNIRLESLTEGNTWDTTTREKALETIETVNIAGQNVAQVRSYYGAMQNRLEHTIKNLDNVVENTQAAESRIRDTDMAAEMVRYSNNNILAQAGQSMLAQANQTNQGVLSLLQ